MRAGVACVSVLGPWQLVLRMSDYPEYSAVAVRTLAVGYVIAIVLSAVGRTSRGMRATLLGLGLALGAVLAMWVLEPCEWVRAGSLIGAFVLLAYGAVRCLVREPGVA